MGSRSRRDPAGHQVRGKGEPTPDAEQNREQEKPQAPGMLTVLVPIAYQGGFSDHPALGKVLDLSFLGPGNATAVIRMKPETWPTMRDAVDQLFREAELAPDTEKPVVAGGIHVASSMQQAHAIAREQDDLKSGGKK